MIGKQAVGMSISVKMFASKYNISKYLARKSIQRNIDNGVMEKYNNRFYYITNDFSTDPESIQRKLIDKAKINLEIARLMNANYIYDKKYVAFIDKQPHQVIIYLPLRKSKITLKLDNDIIHWEYRLILKRNNIKVD